MKQLTIILLLLSSFVGVAQTDSTVYSKYAIMTISEYYSFNCEISEAKGYKLEDKTARVYPMNPSKYCMVDTSLFVALELDVENQKYYLGELFDLNQIAFKDTILIDIEVENSDQHTFDWFGKHYDKTGDKTKKIIWVAKKINKDKAPDEIKSKVKTK